MIEVRLRHGRDEVVVRFPDGVQVDVASPPEPVPTDEAAVATAALASPVGAPVLEQAARGAARVAVVVPDRTRPARTGLWLPLVLDRLAAAGVPPSGVTVLVGGGIHAPATAEEAAQTVGPEAARRARLEASDADESAAFAPLPCDPGLGPVRVHRAVLEADFVVLGGAVAPHYLAGFSGGAKALVPGCADRATVEAAHRRTLDATVAPDGTVRSWLGRVEGNPFRAALERMARALPAAWVFNVGLAGGRIVHAAAGDLVAAHRRACEDHRRLRACARPAPADLVIAGGGHPRDRDLVQAHKGLVVAVEAAKPGAPIVWFARAGDGAGHPSLLPWLEAGRLDRHLAALRRAFHPYGLTAYALRWKCAQRPVHVVSEMARDLLAPTGALPFEDPQAAVDAALARGGVRRVVVLPEAASVFF